MSYGSPSQYCRHELQLKDCTTCQDLIREEQAALLDDDSVRGGVSVDADTLDTMVQQASTPTLATLFKRGKEAGLIQPTTGYGENAGT